MGTSPKQESDHHSNHPDACPVCLSLTTTAVTVYEEGTDEGVFIGEAQGWSQSWMSFKLFPTDFLCS